MPQVNLAGMAVEVDEDGFIQDPSIWNEQLAAAIAPTEDVSEMTEDHWKLVNYIRNYYIQFGIAPMIRKMCKDTGFDLKKVYEMFPTGPAKGACKVAGLPNGKGCV